MHECYPIDWKPISGSLMHSVVGGAGGTLTPRLGARDSAHFGSEMHLGRPERTALCGTGGSIKTRLTKPKSPAAFCGHQKQKLTEVGIIFMTICNV